MVEDISTDDVVEEWLGSVVDEAPLIGGPFCRLDRPRTGCMVEQWWL